MKLANIYAEDNIKFQPIIDAFEKGIQSKYKDSVDTFDLHLTRQHRIDLSYIIIKKEARKSGVGSKIIQELCDFADKHNVTIILKLAHKEKGGTTSQARLMKFYKRFGFVENKGRNKNWDFMDTMYRLPKKNFKNVNINDRTITGKLKEEINRNTVISSSKPDSQ